MNQVILRLLRFITLTVTYTMAINIKTMNCFHINKKRLFKKYIIRQSKAGIRLLKRINKHFNSYIQHWIRNRQIPKPIKASKGRVSTNKTNSYPSLPSTFTPSSIHENRKTPSNNRYPSPKNWNGCPIKGGGWKGDRILFPLERDWHRTSSGGRNGVGKRNLEKGTERK